MIRAFINLDAADSEITIFAVRIFFRGFNGLVLTVVAFLYMVIFSFSWLLGLLSTVIGAGLVSESDSDRFCFLFVPLVVGKILWTVCAGIVCNCNAKSTRLHL